MKSSLLQIFILFYFLFLSGKIFAQKLAVVPYSSVPYVSGLNSPIDIKNCDDDRLFIADKGGLIRIINADGTLRPIPFLDFSSNVFEGSEDGFFGMAFSPNYKTDRKFYVDFTDTISGVVTTFIEEYKVSASDSNVADPSTRLTILTQTQPFNNHLGGNLMFGKDGHLYINFGDGDLDGGDTSGFAQDKSTFLGKILRIDVSNSSIAQPYAIPASNPFFNDSTPATKKEIWAYGLRNPWRSSVDRFTGDLWIADVGESSVEEVDYQPSNAIGGANYGWNIMEGNICFNPSIGCNMTGLTLPIYAYNHTVGKTVIGGYVDRSAQSKALFGMYIFGDFTSKWIDGFRQSGGVISGPVTRLVSATTDWIISFGEDRFGDQYILFNGGGTIYKLQDTSYLRRPKAYFTPIEEGGGTSYLLQGLQGRNLAYQWLNNNVVITGATSPDYTVSNPGIYSLVVTNDLGFSDTSDVFPFGSLPLNLISFTAQKISSGKIALQWKTDSEQNIEGYNVLRKQNNEANFLNIGFVQSKSINGISNSELDYTFIDSSASKNSTLYYKLQIQNKDGSFTYSDIRTIISSGNKINFNFYPNPAKDRLQLNLDGYSQPVVMIIYDNIGKKVTKQVLNQQTNIINISGLKGIYIVQLSDTKGENLIRKKLVVQ